MTTSRIGGCFACLCLAAVLTGCGGVDVVDAEASSPAEAVTEAAAEHGRSGPAAIDDGRPCRGGEQTTARQVRAEVDFEVVVPSHDLADESSIREVWQCPTYVNHRRVVHEDGSTETPRSFKSVGVVLLFDNDIKLYEELSFDAAHADWDSAVASNGGTVAEVHGVPAWLLPPKKPDGDGAVRFVEDNVMVTLVGNGDLSIATLHEMAESLQALTAGAVDRQSAGRH